MGLKHEFEKWLRGVKFHFNISISAKFTSNFQVISDLKPKMLSKISYIDNNNTKFYRQPRIYVLNTFSFMFQLNEYDHLVCVCMNPSTTPYVRQIMLSGYKTMEEF